MKPFDILKVMDRDGNLLEENRAEPVDVIRADTAFVMTNLLRGVVERGTAEAAAQHRLAARRQDRHRRRQHRRLVHRIRSGHHGRRVDRARREEAARPERDRRRRGAADLDGVHEGVHRDARRQGACAGIRGAGQYRLCCRSIRQPAAWPPDRRQRGRKRSSPARSPAD